MPNVRPRAHAIEVGAALLVALAGWALLGASQCAHDRQTARTAVLEDSLRIVARELRAADDSIARLAARYRVDTLRVREVRTRTDTLLARIADTVYVRADTVRLIVAAERQACDAARLTCELRVAAADSAARLYQRQSELWQSMARVQRCRLLFLPCPSRVVVGVAGLALGAAAGAGLSGR